MKPLHFNCRFGLSAAALLLFVAGFASRARGEAEVPLHIQATGHGTIPGGGDDERDLPADNALRK